MWSNWLVFCDCGFHSLCPLMDKDKRLMEASWWENDWGKLGLVLMGRAMLSKTLIQFSIGGWGRLPSLLFDLRPNYGGGNEDNGDLLQKAPCMYCFTHCPDPSAEHCQPMPLPETHRHSWASRGQPLMGSLLLSPGFWYTQSYGCALQEPVSPVLCKF